MDNIKMLSGEELLDKGVTKNEVSLPVLGLKDVTPNGSWLEQKQIQSALEARKHLIEALRIEKRGVLSHAVWREDLKLAEVTQLTGSYWRFVGHQRDRKMHLQPEEALYLMEVNCLLLTYDGIVVSLQQAYSLLLRGDISLNKYKVYAYLSRLGYKVVSHQNASSEISKDEKIEEKGNETADDSNKCTVQNSTSEVLEGNKNEEKDSKTKSGTDKCTVQNVTENIADFANDNNNIILNESSVISNNDEEETTLKNNVINEPVLEKTLKMDICDNELIHESKSIEESKALNNKANGGANTIPEEIGDLVADIENGEIMMSFNENALRKNMDSTTDENSKHFCREDVSEIGECNFDFKTKIDKDPLTKFIEWKLEKLKERQFIMRPNTDVSNNYESIPDLSKSRVVTVNVPKEEFLPKNIFLNHLTYVLNLDNIASKNAISLSDSRTYSLTDEVNGDHVRRVTNSTQQRTHNVVIPPFYQNFRQTAGYRPFQYWRPRPNLSYFQFNLFFQRPFMTNFNMPRFQFYPRTHFPMFPRFFTSPTNFSVCNSSDSHNKEEETTRKRKRNNTRKHHLESIKNLAQRLRQLVALGNHQTENLEALQRLIETYNVRYRTRVRLSDQYEIINDETILETIELDDDEQTKRKRRRVNDNTSLRDLHFNRIKQIAFKLRQLQIEKKASARHRRALSSLIKTYNKCYNADIYMSNNYEILDRLSITLDSSSDPESVVEEVPKMKSGKKLRNPFNILKRLSEKQISVVSPTTSRQDSTNQDLNECNKTETSKNVLLKSTFSKNWLPHLNDFGRPEVLSRDNMNIRIIESKKEEYLYEFLKDKPVKYNNWIETKIAFLENIEESNAIFRSEALKVDSADIKSIIKAEDCTDMPTVLKNLNIIKRNNSTRNDINLAVDFDVYNRDVQNFRKTDLPTPHFRIVCLNDSTPVPSGIEIASLHAKYKDDVMLVFAIVGSSSISFIQMTPTDSPVYTAFNF